MRRLIDVLRIADWLTDERIVAWSLVLLVEELLALLFIAMWQHGVFSPIDTPTSSDFVSFYAAGKLALAGTPALAYDQAAHYFAQEHWTVAGAPYQYFYYPPVFLLLCAALATLPYFVAYALFQVATLALFLLTMRAVLRGSGWRWIPPLLAFPAVFWTIGVGQNAFLTAALFGGFTLLLDRRPLRAGMLIGMLCYKPHFGLLVPIALAAGGRWRAFAAAAATVAALVGASVLLFGWSTWQAYMLALAGSENVYATGVIDFAGYITPFGAARLLGYEPYPAYVTQVGAAVLMGGLVALAWRRNMGQPLRAAILLSATMLSIPLGLLYDKMVVLVAIGWLVREAHETGFLPWERITIAVIYPVSLFTWLIAITSHAPIGPMVSAMVVLLCVRRVCRELVERDRRLAATRPPPPAAAVAFAQAFGATP